MATRKRDDERQVPFRAEAALVARLKVCAGTDGVSLNALITELLDKALKERGL